MSDNYLGQIACFGFGYAPKNWAQCNGQLMSVSQYQALFALLGTTYGGNGIQNFALPDLRSRVPISSGGAYAPGQKGGEETHTLLTPEMPSHNHQLKAQPQAAAASVTHEASSTVALSSGFVTGTGGGAMNFYSTSAPNVALSNGGASTGGVPALGVVGGQPHPNIMPYITLNFCIALTGIFPSRN
ncbi:MAG: phage tail protein [Alphaproteobacteria bacterium]